MFYIDIILIFSKLYLVPLQKRRMQLHVIMWLGRLRDLLSQIIRICHLNKYFVEQLPLKADFQEHKAVFKSILTLYQAGVNLLQSYIHTLLKVAVIILHEEKTVDIGEYLIIIIATSILGSFKRLFF